MNPSARRALVVAVPALLGFLIAPGWAAAPGSPAPPPVATPSTAPTPTRVAAVPVIAIECPDCSDANPCTTDSCDPSTGFCRHDALSCDDGDPCTTNYCERWDPPFGCVVRSLPDGFACSAAGACVGAGVCIAGACRTEPAPEGTSCDTALQCTEGDVCDGAGNCGPGRPSSPGTPCSDGDPCTEDDACGFDDLGSPVCRGTARSCDDGNPCTHDACVSGGTCLNTPVSCDDSNVCTADACDPATGACVHTATSEGGGCTGPDRCTRSSCVAGNCVGTGTPGTICEVHGGCAIGVCNPSNPLLCEYSGDNSRCFQDGPCDYYYCAQLGPPPSWQCRGGGQCSFTQCDRGQCDSRGFCIIQSSLPGAPCDDGNACTINDTCGNGCVGTPISCDDQNICTADLCDPRRGCSHVDDPRACDDGNPCTEDGCDGAACTHTPLDAIACDDGSVCTTGTMCVQGLCGGAEVVTCDDENVCTVDTCDPILGCRHEAVVCASDGNPCTEDICNSVDGCASVPGSGMACAGDGNACTVDACVNGVCAHTPAGEGTFCGGAGDPCGVSVCRAGICTPSQRCDDGNQCTRDDCLTGGGCANLPQPTGYWCSDGNPCTEGDFCAIGNSGEPVCMGIGVPPRHRTCGTGACERTVDICAGGVPQTCVPGEPAMESCNGIDDDCDGHVDENRVRAICALRPVILLDPPMRTEFTLSCRFRDRCDGSLPLLPTGVDADAVWVSRADRLADMNDDVSLPDPATLACLDPESGTAWEPGIVETTAARVTGADSVMFHFNTPHDGTCSTLDGDKTALLERLSGTPNGLIFVCVSGRYAGAPWEGCAVGLLRR